MKVEKVIGGEAVCRIELSLVELNGVLHSLGRTMCKGDELTISMELEDELCKLRDALRRETKPVLKDRNGEEILEGHTLKKVNNTDRGMFQGGVVSWDEAAWCFRCGKVTLYDAYMEDFEIVK